MNFKQIFLAFLTVNILFISNALFAQKTFLKANVGYGIWESFYAGLDLQIKNVSFGLDIGTSFNTAQFDNKYFSVTFESTYYWGKENKYNFKSWYLNARIIYWSFSEPNTTWKVIQICPTIGREFNFTRKAGINFDIGPAILLHANRQDATEEKVGWIYPVYPECRIGFFYRFNK